MTIDFVNQSRKERNLIEDFKNTLMSTQDGDKGTMWLFDYQIATLVREGLLVKRTPQSWFHRWFVPSWQPTWTGCENITVLKRSYRK